MRVNPMTEDKFRYNLIKLGKIHPQLRPHLRVLIANDDFNRLFGELRSVLNGKKDLRTYKQVLRVVVEMDAIDRARTENQVVPYVHRALDKFPDEVRTMGPLTLRTYDKPASRYKIEFAKVYNDRSLPFSSLSKNKALARKVLLGTKANQGIINLVLGKVALTNEEALWVANNFAPNLGSLSFEDRNMPKGTLLKLKVIPSYLYVEGNPQIQKAEVEAFLAKHPHVVVSYDKLEGEPLPVEEMYAEFARGMGGMFDGPASVSSMAGGAPEVRGSFGRDAHEGRQGHYLVTMMPVREDDTNIRFEIIVEGNGYEHESVEVFDWPRTDDEDGYLTGNRHVFKIVRKINDLLYDIMRGRA